MQGILVNTARNDTLAHSDAVDQVGTGSYFPLSLPDLYLITELAASHWTVNTLDVQYRGF